MEGEEKNADLSDCMIIIESLHFLTVDGVYDPRRSVGKGRDSFARRRGLLPDEGVVGERGAQALHQVVLHTSVYRKKSQMNDKC